MAYAAIFFVGLAHKMFAGGEWTSFRFLGGILDPPTPGIDPKSLMGVPSFAV